LGQQLANKIKSQLKGKPTTVKEMTGIGETFVLPLGHSANKLLWQQKGLREVTD